MPKTAKDFTVTPEQQIENLRMAYAIMSGIPAERVRLNVDRAVTFNALAASGTGYGVEYLDEVFTHDCKSVGCVCGWLAAHPYFQAQGLVYHGRTASNKDGVELLDMDATLFGDQTIFDSGDMGIVGKRDALARIRNALRQRRAISDECNAQFAKFEQSLKN